MGVAPGEVVLALVFADSRHRVTATYIGALPLYLGGVSRTLIAWDDARPWRSVDLRFLSPSGVGFFWSIQLLARFARLGEVAALSERGSMKKGTQQIRTFGVWFSFDDTERIRPIQQLEGEKGEQGEEGEEGEEGKEGSNQQVPNLAILPTCTQEVQAFAWRFREHGGPFGDAC